MEKGTLQARFGFSDPDLATPLHDALMTWLDGAMPRIVADCVQPETADQYIEREYSTPERREYERHQMAGAELPAAAGARIISKVWEKPILTRTQYTVGFVDMAVVIHRPALTRVTMPKGKSIWGRAWEQQTLYFEVKPKIYSLGEVIRQIRMYQVHVNGPFYIVCPDTRYAEALAGQGIGFIEAMGAQYANPGHLHQ